MPLPDPGSPASPTTSASPPPTSAAAPELGARHEFVEANGLRFHVAAMGAPESDRLALCLHGFPECWFSWRHQLPLLARHGYLAWAPDLRGYGETDRPTRVADYALEHLMDDVGGLIDASGAREVVLLAHDWGALIAWYFAIRKIRPLDRLVIMNVPHPVAGQRAFRTFEQLRKSWYAFFFQLPWLPERLLGARRARAIGQAFSRSAVHPERFDKEVLRVYREAALRPGALTAMINYYRAFGRGGGGRRQQALGIPPIEVPTLMIWGEQDMALSLSTTVGTEKHVRDFTFRGLPDASHWVQQDAPDEVNAMLDAWLRDEPVPGEDTRHKARLAQRDAASSRAIG